jgi:uncharacterized protein (DUF488 family)
MSEEFQSSIRELIELATESNVAIMCSEKLCWRCHRRIICDHILSKGHGVTHIFDLDRVAKHELPSFARILGGSLTYPGT